MKSKNAILRLENITHMMGAKELFENVNAEIVGGQVVGLIGPNGAGKTTLMNIMAGLIDPRSGSVEVEGERELLTQGLDADLSLSVYEYIQSRRELDNKLPLEEREVQVALSKTGGKDIDIYMPLSSLSGGQRTLVRITKSLIDKVDILLLDEPTNHLDRDGIAFLQSVVKKFQGIVVIVSHDRQFLEDVCTDIFDLRWGDLEQYEGSYKGYIKEREQRAIEQMRDREDQQEKKEKAEKWLIDMRRRAAIHDDSSYGGKIRSKQKLYERTFVEGKIEKNPEENKMQMELIGGEDQEKEMLILKQGIVGWVDEKGDQMKPIYKDVDSYEKIEGEKNTMFQTPEQLNLYGQDRVVIVGENGSGKSTFLKVLHENIGDGTVDQDTLITRGENIRIGWFSQHDESLTVDERVMKWCLDKFPAGWDQEMITKKLGDANIPEADLVKRMSELSYGQRMKIRFLQLLLNSYDLLILDEPTNHLDIATREELELMLQKYEGALLIVSHDRWFVEEIGVISKWRIRNKQMEVLGWKKKHSDKGR